jgi:regulator of sigma E protease
MPGSAAEAGGIHPGDAIVSIDGRSVDRFEDVQQVVRLNPSVPMTMVVRRDGTQVDLRVTPSRVEESDRLGRRQIGQLGIRGGGTKYVKRDPASAVVSAVGETWNLSATTLQAMWQMVIGTRTTDELGGPLRIAQLSGEIAQGGIVPLLWFMAVLSVNLGLINLFPVPVLDGGHLLYYAAEAIRGKPLGQRAQEYGFRVGLALVLTLMVFATWNDLVHTGIVDIVKRFVT